MGSSFGARSASPEDRGKLIDYELTDIGRTLLTPITALHEWAVAHRDDIRHARARHDNAVNDPEAGSKPASVTTHT